MRIFIAGGSGIIGSCIVENFLKLGFHCTIHASQPKSFKKINLTQYDKSKYDLFCMSDLEISEKNAKRKLEVLGNFDVFINACGGAGAHEKWEDTSIEKWKNVYSSNVLLPVFMLNGMISKMKARGRGKIINIASVAGVRALQVGPEYSAAKAALIKLTESLAKDCENTGITVNCISPGLVISRNLTNTLMKKEGEYNMMTLGDIDKYLSNIFPNLIGNLPTCQDVADIILFLTSNKGDRITGQNIIIDSGYSLSNYPKL